MLKILFFIFFFCACSCYAGDDVDLSEGQKHKASRDIKVKKLKARGKGNKVEGDLLLDDDIEIKDKDSDLTVGINTRLSGDIILNGGKLILEEDLRFIDNKFIKGSGHINLNKRRLSFGTRPLTWTDSIFFEDALDIDLNSNLTLNSTWTFSGDATLTGNNNVLILDALGNIVVEPDSTLLIKDITIQNVGGSKIRCLADSSAIMLQNVKWIQDSDYSFTMGSLEFSNNVCFAGLYTFSYESSQTMTIDAHSEMSINDDIRFVMGKAEAGGSDPIYMADKSSSLHFNDSTLVVTASGMQFDQGKLVISGDSYIEANSTSTNNGLEFGDGTIPSNLEVIFHPGAHLTLVKGHFVYNAGPTSFRSVSPSAKLEINPNSQLYIKKDAQIKNLSLKSGSLTSLVTEGVAAVSYSNVRFITGNFDFDIVGTRYNSMTHLFSGNESLFISRGAMPFISYINGTGNKFHGTGSITGPIFFLDSTATLSFDINGNILGDVSLSGGTVTLNNNLALGQGTQINGPGAIELGTSQLKFGAKDLSWTSTLYWDGSAGSALNLNSKLSLSSTWTFSGTTTINGRSHTLELMDTGEIVLEYGATLCFQDIRLSGVSGTKIRCLDDAGTIIFDSVSLAQDGTYSFTIGSFEVLNKLDLKESYTFDYQSSKQSTIKSRSALRVRNGSVFYYNPSVADNDLLVMEDETSRLCLDGATLYSTTTGLHLTKGELEVRGLSHISSDATTEGEGIYFGDGGSLANDVTVHMLPGARLKLTGGYIIDNNVGQ